MSSNKKPRKKYRPKPISPDPLGYVLSGMTLVSQNTRTLLEVINHGSMAALTTGKGTKEDWDNVCSLLNITLVLNQQVYQGSYTREIEQAMAAHAACGKRFGQHGRFGYTGEELKTVNTAMWVHDEQLAKATIKEIEDAKIEVFKRLKARKFKYWVNQKEI